jgi:hypothetical protein
MKFGPRIPNPGVGRSNPLGGISNVRHLILCRVRCFFVPSLCCSLRLLNSLSLQYVTGGRVKLFLTQFSHDSPRRGDIYLDTGGSCHLQLSCSSQPFSKVNSSSSAKGKLGMVVKSCIQISFCFCDSGIREERRFCSVARSHRYSCKGCIEFMIAAIRSPAGSLSPQ